jgi:Uma2 family endonuclease
MRNEGQDAVNAFREADDRGVHRTVGDPSGSGMCVTARSDSDRSRSICLYLATLTGVRATDRMRAMAPYETKTRRWTRIEYEKLVDLGIFQLGEPIELIGGELMVAEPQGAAHYTAIWKTAKALEAAFGPGWVVRTQGPIGLDEESEPEPDVAVVPGGPDDYRQVHPSRPALTVEVAESSLGSDRERKGSLYARAGLADYWVVNLVDSVLEVYREPVADPSAPFGWRYARREVFDPAAQVRPLAAPGAISIRALLP